VAKRYDPLWEIVGEKVALQGHEPDLDAPCPHCHVTVHIPLGARMGDRFACGLCGGHIRIAKPDGTVTLEKAASED
jgi:hypothetical protein